MRPEFLISNWRINWWASKGPWVLQIPCKHIFISVGGCIGWIATVGSPRVVGQCVLAICVPNTALGRTGLHLNPVVFHGVPQPPSCSVLTTTSLQSDFTHFTPSLNSYHTPPALYINHTEQVYLSCSFIIHNLITNSLRQEACLLEFFTSS